MEDKELREDQAAFMVLLKEQNLILRQQSELLTKICAFITPVSAFFAALKNFVIFMAWVLGVIAACVALWQGFVTWLLNWAKGQ